jgi:hypothetical protein
MNMSYVRFQNTLKELRDCFENIHDEDLSDAEESARKKLIELCRQIADEFEQETDPASEGLRAAIDESRGAK